MQIKNYYSLLFFVVATFLSYAQELPPIQVFTPQAYGAENQNWAIAQGPNKYIYVANNRGLLEYNGANWQLYPSPNETIIRSVTVGKDKIYTGSYMEFGYWQRNDYGLLEYTSLSDTLSVQMIEDEQIWKIISLNNWIVFQSLNRIYLLDVQNSRFKIIDSDYTIPKMFLVDGTIMFQKINKGIYKIENGIAKIFTSDNLIKNESVINVYAQDENILIQTVGKGFYVLQDGIVKEWDIEANDKLKSINVYSSIRLRDRSFALGTISNGLIHLTRDGKISSEINQISGLSDNTVLSVFEDMNDNLWLGLDNGISCVNMKSPFLVFNDQKGNLGTVYASALHKGSLYIGTNQGLFYKKQGTNDEFKLIEGTKGQVWNLIIHDGTLFCGHNDGTLIIDGDTFETINDKVIGTWDIKPIPNKPNELLQGNYEGLNVLWKRNGKWGFKNSIKGFNNSCRFFEISKNNTIYVSHEYKGVYDLKMNSDYNEVTNISWVSELTKGFNASLTRFDDDILYAHKEGIFKFNETTEKFVKDPLLSSVFSNDNYVTGKLVMDHKANRLWSFTEDNISYIDQGKLSETPEIHRIAIPDHFRKSMTGFENIKSVGNNRYLFGKSNGYLIIDVNSIKGNREFEVSINTIKKGKLGITNTNVSLKESVELSNSENNIEFSYSVPEFSKYYEVEYRYQLEGMYDQWSNWSTKSSMLFDNLPHGDYTFNVSARIGETSANKITSYEFNIEKPWYLTNLMMVIYVLGLVFFSFFMHMMYRRYYKKQQRKLLEKSRRDLELKQLENEQQRILFKNETLSKDIESKSRELAISTMSLIKKNEFLNNIKNELNDVESNHKLNSVIKIIDKNLSNTDDWKFFEEAFNNADKDFLKKMKSVHSDLTSNDLRLCAYLRLNLSSKEIAPLLNISPRSVEVKRYRLRKKMDLPHEASLTNYILEI